MTTIDARVRQSFDRDGRRILTHSEAGTVTREVLVQRARELVPILRQRARACEEARQLLPETVADFTNAGFFRIVSPKRYGGFELGIDTLEEVALEVGRGCGSSAWCLAILGGHSWWSALFNEEAQQAIFGDEGHVIMATNLSGNGRARRVEGGFRLSGRFTYLSGCDVANWLCVGAAVEEADGALTWYYMPLRPAQAQIVDEWDVLGMRGTGSKVVTVRDAFVPEHMVLEQRLVQLQEQPGRYLHAGPLYAAPMMAFLYIETTGAGVGVALGAVDALDELLQAKPVRLRGRDAAATQPILQMQVPAVRRHLAEAKSLAETAKLLLLSEAERLMRTLEADAKTGRRFEREEMMEYGLRNARVVDLCVQAVDHCFIAGGTSSTVTGNPIERAFRDIHMISTHRALQIDLATENWATAHFSL
jgi:3-hydroxy-9,10-secoandrosta-1,3,5(10)-triene-9,17-dione monooxygenase